MSSAEDATTRCRHSGWFAARLLAVTWHRGHGWPVVLAHPARLNRHVGAGCPNMASERHATHSRRPPPPPPPPTVILAAHPDASVLLVVQTEGQQPNRKPSVGLGWRSATVAQRHHCILAVIGVLSTVMLALRNLPGRAPKSLGKLILPLHKAVGTAIPATVSTTAFICKWPRPSHWQGLNLRCAHRYGSPLLTASRRQLLAKSNHGPGL